MVGGVDYYEVLGVGRTASPAEIRVAYRALAKVMHPDAGGTTTTFQLLRDAYETLRDPVRRAAYDTTGQPAGPAARAARRAARAAARAERPDAGSQRVPAARRAGQTGRLRGFGADPAFVPPPLRIDLDTVPWWPAGPVRRERFVPAIGPARGLVLGAAVGWIALVLMVLTVPTGSVVWTVVLWVAVAAGGVAVFRLAHRAVLAALADRAFVAEAGGRTVFGTPGGEDDQVGERLTARMLAEYLAPLPGTRIFHGLAWPGSVFADVDHAVLRGRRMVLIESKMWLPGHYTADELGTVWRNGHPFRGGAIRLPDGVAAYRKLLPGVDVRGALVVYPSRAGDVTTGESPDVPAPPMSPERFVREIGEWLAEEPATVDRDTFRTVLDRLVS